MFQDHVSYMQQQNVTTHSNSSVHLKGDLLASQTEKKKKKHVNACCNVSRKM